MKTLTLTISFIMMLSAPLFAQTGWYQIYSSNSKMMESVFFTNDNTGYVAGYEWISGYYYPFVLKTVNGGLNWTPQPTPQTDSANYGFRCVFFTDANTGFLNVVHITDNNIGRLLKTTNGGINWNIVPIPVSKHMTSINFLNSSTGYATGTNGTILKTTNGGNNWFSQNSGTTFYLFEIHFTDINTGYICGNHGTILKTTNGGNNWDYLNTGTSIHLWGMTFTDMNTGIAVGAYSNNTENIILRTTNAGSTWVSIPRSDTTCFLWSVKFANQNTGWISGDCGQILKTVNGGLTWTKQGAFTSYFMKSFFLNANTGYVSGSGILVKTTDGGGIISGIEPPNNEIPAQFQLFQNYPNPFNPVTAILFSLPEESHVSLIIYDMLGREVQELTNKEYKAGTYELSWNASNYPSGVYFYRLETAGFTETKKMVLVK